MAGRRHRSRAEPKGFRWQERPRKRAVLTCGSFFLKIPGPVQRERLSTGSNLNRRSAHQVTRRRPPDYPYRNFRVTTLRFGATGGSMAHGIEDIEIQPNSEALECLNLSTEDFYQALEKSLDSLSGRRSEELPAPASIPIVVRGQQHRLGELAQITVSLDSGQAARCV